MSPLAHDSVSLDPEDLLRFLAVADAGSFQAAADRLLVDRSVLSRRVAALEKALGVRLLRRSTRSLSLTEAGSAIAARARKLQSLLDEVQQIADDTQQEARGLLRITSSTHFGSRCVMPALLQYQRLYPQVTIDLELDNRRTDLTAEGFDLAVRIGEPTDAWGIARKLCTNHVCLAASPEFLKRHSSINSLSDLTALPAVSYAAEGLRFAQLEHLDDTGALRASPMQIVFWCNNTEALLQATLAGIGWGCMSRFLAHEDLVAGRLVQLLPDVRMPPYKSVYVVYGRRELPLRVRLFLEVLESSVAQWAAWEG